ncbi:MAG: hypothetical protein ABW133_01060 [Polyangiaceae bacterium]
MTERRIELPDLSNGAIRLHPSGLLLGSSTTEAGFRSTTEGTASAVLAANPPHLSYRLAAAYDLGGTPVGLSLSFSFELLTRARIFVFTGAQSSGDRSEERELRHRDILENLLHKAYGNVRTFPWGRVRAAYDSRSGGSSISVSYEGSRGR